MSLLQAERARRAAESERAELAERVTDSGQTLTSLQSTKRKLEQQLSSLQVVMASPISCCVIILTCLCRRTTRSVSLRVA